MRQKILMCAEEYAAAGGLDKKLNGDQTMMPNGGDAPSAPSAGDEPSAPSGIPPPAVYEKPNGANGSGPVNGAAAAASPSAPPQTVDTFKSTECVICLEKKVFFCRSVSKYIFDPSIILIFFCFSATSSSSRVDTSVAAGTAKKIFPTVLSAGQASSRK